MIDTPKSKELTYLGTVIFAAILVMLPIAILGIPSGNDLPQHFQFAHTYYDSITDGDWFPNWSDKENSGYGGPGIRFYPPLAYYTLAFARILVGNWFDATWLTFMFWMILGGIGIYYWTRWWFPARESAIAAVLFAFVPNHLNQIYIAFNYAEFAAAAVLPFCFAFLTRVFSRGKLSDIAGLSVSYAALILTHLPTSLLGSICLGIYALTFLQKNNYLRQIGSGAVALLVGLSASAFYWVGMLSEMKWLNHASERYSTGHYSFDNNFFPLYIYGDEKLLTGGLILADFFILLNFAFLLSAIVYLVYRKKENVHSAPERQIFHTVLPVGLFAFFMVTCLSRPFWEYVPMLSKVQFPTRWMSVVAMCGAIVTAAAVHYLVKGNFLRQRRWAYSAVIFLAALFIFNVVYIFNPGSFMPIARFQFEDKLRHLPSEESFNCWWTVWGRREALENKEKVFIYGPSRQTRIVSWLPEERYFEVAEGEKTSLKISTFYYPHWKAVVNGIPTEIEKDENGVMMLSLPAEKALVKISFQEPLAVRTAAFLSVFTWLLFIPLFFVLWHTKLSPKTSQTHFVEEEISC